MNKVPYWTHNTAYYGLKKTAGCASVLEYPRENPQSREKHFSDPEKKARYELLRAKLNGRLGI